MNPILKIAKSLEPDLLQFLREIVAIPSFCGQEEKVIARIKKEMEKIGYHDIHVDKMGNLLGRMGEGKRIIAIDGHCDTVEIGNREQWSVDPFGAKVQDRILYGRGACDQKGGLACAIYAGKILQEVGIPDDVSFWMVTSVQEEDCEGLAWKYIIEEDNITPDTVLLTEPTNLNLCRGQRGRLEFKVKTKGVSSHGSAPERGENAIYKMIPIMKELEQLSAQFKPDPFLGKGSLTVTDIHATSPSLCAVPDSSTIHIDRRLTPNETIETCTSEITSLPAYRDVGAEIWTPKYEAPSYKGETYPMKSYFPGWILNEDHPIIQIGKEAYNELFGAEPVIGRWAFSTNGVATMGMYQIPTFGFGPGKEEFAHSPNEQIKIDQLVDALAFYAAFVRKFKISFL